MSQGDIVFGSVMQRKTSAPPNPIPTIEGGNSENSVNNNNQENQEIANEYGIQVLHNWIQDMCDPEINFSAKLNRKLPQDWDKSIQISREDLLSKKIGQISLSGLSAPGNLDDISEENEIGESVERMVNIRKSDGTVFEGFYSNGKPHGFFRHLNDYGDLEFFGFFCSGVLQGVCWKSLPGGGFLISQSWTFSGDSLIYLYPDCRTGLVGKFQDSVMEAAQKSEVRGFVETGPKSLILQPQMSRPQGPFFSFEEAHIDNFCRSPTTEDPYEALFVEVKQSKISKAGEGLFAKTDIEVGTIISFYNGLKVRAGFDWEKPTPYRMILDDANDLDVPDDMTSLQSYRASLGHKVCHSFQPNAETDVFFHPRFGLIRCVASLRRIRAGEEILIDYKYNLSSAPAWYKVAWAKHQKIVRGLPDWKSALHMNNIKIGSRRSSWALWIGDDD